MRNMERSIVSLLSLTVADFIVYKTSHWKYFQYFIVSTFKQLLECFCITGHTRKNEREKGRRRCDFGSI